jgi:prophage regulatory protein
MGEVEHRVGLDKRTIHRKVKAESFPKPVPLGDRRIGFLEHEIEAWIDARISERDGGAA